MVDMTYVALKPIRVGGERREPGQLVPEAADWPRVEASIAQNRIAKVPVSSVNQDELKSVTEAYEVKKAERAQGETEVEEVPEQVGTSTSGDEASPPESDAPPDVENYHAGSGWYEIPGLDKKVRRDEAVSILEERGEE